MAFKYGRVTIIFETTPLTARTVTLKELANGTCYAVIKDQTGGVFFCYSNQVFDQIKEGDRCMFKGFLNRTHGAMYLVIREVTFVTDLETPEDVAETESQND